MRFLADESCDFSVMRALRSAKHDVVAIAEVSPRAEDDDVRERAVSDERILITEDKDFGQLVYASNEENGRGNFHSVSGGCAALSCGSRTRSRETTRRTACRNFYSRPAGTR
jgi:hypothetical protein